jgi:hypothetical protein
MDTENKQSSVWTKIIAISAMFIALLLGYSTLSVSMNDKCAAKALRASVAVTVIQTKWSLSGCQYLYSINGSGSKPDWGDAGVFEAIFVEKDE